MTWTSVPGRIGGTVSIPGSKSHTIRALLIAAFAEGHSIVDEPLDSGDARSCIAACRLLGSELTEHRDESGRLQKVDVVGLGGVPHTPENVIDVGNSGTTLYLALGLAALGEGTTVFTGDEQIRRRSADRLVASLNDLGARVYSTRPGGCAPIVVQGPLRGGHTTIECPTSQYLSSLLLSCSLAPEPSEITVPLLYERPYVEMTIAWLNSQGVEVERDGYTRFAVKGGARFQATSRRVPGDFSSASFPACAAALSGARLELGGLDMSDSQGDKQVFEILRAMGCTVEVDAAAETVTIEGPPRGELRGGEFDLNAIPDALPALAVTACYASEPVTLGNVPQARLKETDRIAVMCSELSKQGVHIEELPAGVRVLPSRMKGGEAESHGDHRVAMAMAIGALGAEAPITIHNAGVAEITYPGFFEMLDSLRV